MRTLYLTIFISISLLASGQVDSMIYDQSNNLKNNFGTSYFSTLILKNDNSFLFQYKESSCTAWYDKKGTWSSFGDTLILMEEVICEHVVTKKEESINIKIKYQISQDELIFIGYDLLLEHFKPIEEIISSKFKKRKTTANKN